MHRGLRSSAGVAIALACLFGTSACSIIRGGPDEPAPPPRGGQAQDSAGGGGGGRGGAPPEPRPYDRVITSAAETQTGLFRTHRINDKLYFEIPRSELGREMLVVSRRIGGGPTTGFFGGGGANRVVTWERDGNRILLRQQSYDIYADSSNSIHRAVSAMRTGPIIAAFNVESWAPDSAAVIDVTRLYTTNVNEFAVVNQLPTDRRLIDSVAADPENVNVIATQTGTQQPQGGQGGGGGGGGGGQQRPETITARNMWSMLKLPENPMM